MPKISQTILHDITVKKFLDACDQTELLEIDLLLGTQEYQSKMAQSHQKNDGDILPQEDLHHRSQQRGQKPLPAYLPPPQHG